MHLIPKPRFWNYIYLFQTDFSSKIYDKRNDFDFDIVNFPSLILERGGGGEGGTFSVLYLTVFTFIILFDLLELSSHVTDFNARNKVLTA